MLYVTYTFENLTCFSADACHHDGDDVSSQDVALIMVPISSLPIHKTVYFVDDLNRRSLSALLDAFDTAPCFADA